ncbi:MAG: hypothetical protein HY852_06170 [Bradyrhizobium sp.]|uniref:hypothetical protein n=1 Tax=Bradyrhizobium sp. TaxID=376 RepID=UPI0025B7BEA0|nr:hypothetical protein [Bradyrhizobium sp.]MBI5261389.1 hypothetical protein [Bradyrhizobium sp.]
MSRYRRARSPGELQDATEAARFTARNREIQKGMNVLAQVGNAHEGVLPRLRQLRMPKPGQIAAIICALRRRTC